MSNEQRFSNVWAAIEDTVPAAASMQARSSLMMAVQSWAKTSQGTQAEAARVLGITQPRMSDLMRGKINLFSLDSLLDMAALADLKPQITVNSVPTDADGINVQERFRKGIHASAGNGVVCEVRSEGDDGSRLVVGAETSGSPATSSESHLKLVKMERAA